MTNHSAKMSSDTEVKGPKCKRRRNNIMLENGTMGECRICGATGNGIYFGVLTCIPCKAFYIRTTAEDIKKLSCLHGNQQCIISKETRSSCKFCRFQRCITEGMARRERPTSSQHDSDGKQLCVVCEDKANGVHFGAVTCEGCKKFFRRGLQEGVSYKCSKSRSCEVTLKARNSCRACRWQKCLDNGMSRQAIQMGRPSRVGASEKASTSRASALKRKIKIEKIELPQTEETETYGPTESYPFQIQETEASSDTDITHLQEIDADSFHLYEITAQRNKHPAIDTDIKSENHQQVPFPSQRLLSTSRAIPRQTETPKVSVSVVKEQSSMASVIPCVVTSAPQGTVSQLRASPSPGTVSQLRASPSPGTVSQLRASPSPGTVSQLRASSPGTVSQLRASSTPGTVSQLRASPSPGTVSQLRASLSPGTVSQLRVSPGIMSHLIESSSTASRLSDSPGIASQISASPGVLSQSSSFQGRLSQLSTSPERMSQLSASPGIMSQLSASTGTMSTLSVSPGITSQFSASPAITSQLSASPGIKSQLSVSPGITSQLGASPGMTSIPPSSLSVSAGTTLPQLFTISGSITSSYYNASQSITSSNYNASQSFTSSNYNASSGITSPMEIPLIITSPRLSEPSQPVKYQNSSLHHQPTRSSMSSPYQTTPSALSPAHSPMAYQRESSVLEHPSRQAICSEDESRSSSVQDYSGSDDCNQSIESLKFQEYQNMLDDLSQVINTEESNTSSRIRMSAVAMKLSQMTQLKGKYDGIHRSSQNMSVFNQRCDSPTSALAKVAIIFDDAIKKSDVGLYFSSSSPGNSSDTSNCFMFDNCYDPKQEMKPRSMDFPPVDPKYSLYWTLPLNRDAEVLTPEIGALIGILVMAYEFFLNRMEETYLKCEEMKAKNIAPACVLQYLIMQYLKAASDYYNNIPGYRHICESDRKLLTLARFQENVLLMASGHFFDAEKEEFTKYYPYIPAPDRMDYPLYLACISYGKMCSALDMEHIELAILSALVIMGTDVNGLAEPEKVEEQRRKFLKVFNIYTTGKYGSCNERISMLFRVIPPLRGIGEVFTEVAAKMVMERPDEAQNRLNLAKSATS